uniref:NADP-dependent oxidoreductase domain-containing protein n=1 Tax=Aegilops tauschii subsp. strangulata TaxID=200361 RepID=A0A453R816_AEGTS
MEQSQMARVKLGTQGLEVSKIGFGCMGLTGVYNDPVPEDAGVAVIRRAFDAGVTFFDTADAYGPHTNEVLLGKVKILLLLSLSKLEYAVFVLCSLRGGENGRCSAPVDPSERQIGRRAHRSSRPLVTV